MTNIMMLAIALMGLAYINYQDNEYEKIKELFERI